MLRTLPPTGAPIQFRDLCHGLAAVISRVNNVAGFQEQIQKYFNVKHVFLTSSGKASVYLALTALRQMSKRREVILPAYSSFCLASAVARTGLPVRLCDIEPATLDFDLDKLKLLINKNTLAVIPVHNYGLVCRLREIQRLASAKGTWVIEDAAQAAGALFESRKVGTIGDIGILSLGRGKNICALGGGVILTDHNKVAAVIAGSLKKCPVASAFSDAANFAAGIGMSLFLKPEKYALPAALPFLGLGANIFDPKFKIIQFSTIQEQIGQRTFLNLDKYNNIRIQNALLLKNNLAPSAAFSLPSPASNTKGQSVYLRFPILFTKKKTRDQTFQLLGRQRLGTSYSYPKPLNEILGFQKYLIGENNFPGAKFVADRILTLPTHPYVKETDIFRITSTIYNSIKKEH